MIDAMVLSAGCHTGDDSSSGTAAIGHMTTELTMDRLFPDDNQRNSAAET
jgi:hypothetical protein